MGAGPDSYTVSLPLKECYSKVLTLSKGREKDDCCVTRRKPHSIKWQDSAW